MAASNDELTAQIVLLTDQIQTLSNRLSTAEQNQTLQHAGSKGREHGVFDKERLYPKELKEASSFRSWSERFIAWIEMDNAEVPRAFLKAGKQEEPLVTS